MARKRTPAHLPGTKIKLPPALAPLLVPIDSIHEDPANPRKTLDVGHLVGLLKRFGYTDPVVVNAEGMILAGKHRRLACVQLGATQIPALAVDHDPITGTAYGIAHNRSNEVVAEWDQGALVPLLAKLQAEDAELTAALGWAEDELAAMLEQPTSDGGGEGESPDVEPPVDPQTQPGDMLELGPHRVVCGDCRDPAVVTRLIGDERINVAFTSPPYAERREYDKSSDFKPIPADEYVAWFEAVQANVRAHMADDGSMFVNIKAHADGLSMSLYVLDLVIAMVRSWGWRYSSEYCWERIGLPGLPKRRFKNQFEPVYHFASEEWKFRPKSVRHASDNVPSYDRSNNWSDGLVHVAGSSGDGWANIEEGLAYPGNRLPPYGVGNETSHAASFPIGLPSFFILAYSDASDVIFDPFMGSGTTMLAAHRTKRVARGCEISPRYCDVIAARWCAESGELAHLLRGNERIPFSHTM